LKIDLDFLPHLGGWKKRKTVNLRTAVLNLDIAMPAGEPEYCLLIAQDRNIFIRRKCEVELHYLSSFPAECRGWLWQWYVLCSEKHLEAG